MGWCVGCVWVAALRCCFTCLLSFMRLVFTLLGCLRWLVSLGDLLLEGMVCV